MTMLLVGLDPIALTLKMKDAIADWASHDRSVRPWIALEKAGQ